MERLEVYYTGTVQGVGFRYTVLQLSKLYSVSGFVRNLGDARVHLIVEGDKAVLDAFQNKIERGYLKQYISEKQESWTQAQKEFSGFQIIF